MIGAYRSESPFFRERVSDSTLATSSIRPAASRPHVNETLPSPPGCPVASRAAAGTITQIDVTICSMPGVRHDGFLVAFRPSTGIIDGWYLAQTSS